MSNTDNQNQGHYFLEGVRARESGVGRDANPYSADEVKVDEAYDWFMGWDDADAILNLRPEAKQDA